MKYYYSKSTNGFYRDDIHTPAQIPSDAVTVTLEAYGALFAGQTAGKVITGDANGNPVNADPPPVQPDYAALTKSDETILRCAEHGIAVPAAWAAYRAALRVIVAGRVQGPLPARPAYPAGT